MIQEGRLFTRKERMEMYMALPKESLAELLINANDTIAKLTPTVSFEEINRIMYPVATNETENL